MSKSFSQPAESASTKLRFGAVYALLLLFLVNAFNLGDRLALSVLMEPMKRELHLSDTQIGLLSGFAFALVYSTMAFPLARLSDLGNRRNVLALSLGVWSAMTALCGVAQNYWQLLLARVGVGAGEAGGGPPSYSMLSDLFPARHRATVIAIFTAGAVVGAAVGRAVAGWAADAYGWRAGFIVMGLPGLALALLLRFTMAEPARPPDASRPGARPSWADVWRSLTGNTTFLWLAVGAGLLSVVVLGINQWSAVFFMRSHGLTATQVGLQLGLGGGVLGIVGTIVGGWLSDRLSSRDARWAMWLAALVTLASLPPMLLGFYANDVKVAMVAYLVGTTVGNMALGPVLAQVQSVAKPRERATAAAVVMAMLSLVGLGASGLFIGMGSDLLAPTFGLNSVRHALALTLPVGIGAAYCFWHATRTVLEEMVRAQA